MHHMQPAKLNGLGAPEVYEFPVEAAATFAIGAPVTRDGVNPNEVEEHPGLTTVTGVLGVALQGATAGVPDFGNNVQVALANAQIEFLAHMYDSGGAAYRTVTGDGSFEGNTYGILKVGTNWVIDEDDTTNVVVKVIKEYPQINLVGFKWIATAIQQ